MLKITKVCVEILLTEIKTYSQLRNRKFFYAIMEFVMFV